MEESRIDSESSTRTAIKEAALQAFCRLGFEQAKMRDIAQASGVQVSVIYYHYASKEDLYTEAVFDGIVALFAALRARVSFARDRALPAILADLLAARSPANLTDQEAALYRLSILEWMGHRGDRALTRKLRDMIAASRSEFLVGLQRRASATGTDADPMVADLVYRYLEHEAIRMLFDVAPFDRYAAERELQHILSPVLPA
jgi:AcrR family transcriptional regulator